MHQSSGLERVIRALGPHARGGDSPQLGVEKLNQPADGLMVAVAKARHQPGYGIGLKSGWDGQSGTSLSRPEKKFKSNDTIRRPTLPLRGERSVETQDGSLTERSQT